MGNEFEGKVVVVTGASQGIGEAIAIAFAREKAAVVVGSRDEKKCREVAKKVEKAGGKSLVVVCDVSLREQADKIVGEAVKKFGKLDVLVNNAGIFPFVPVLEMKDADWDKVINVNLKGTFMCSQAAAKQMTRQKTGGSIVNISSIASIKGYSMLVHYCASKGGVNGLTRAMAVELAKSKIRVNAIAPGGIRTPGIGAVDEKVVAAVAASTPLGRIGEPEEIAQAALFLASERASYVTGHVLVVDGGSTI